MARPWLAAAALALGLADARAAQVRGPAPLAAPSLPAIGVRSLPGQTVHGVPAGAALPAPPGLPALAPSIIPSAPPTIPAAVPGFRPGAAPSLPAAVAAPERGPESPLPAREGLDALGAAAAAAPERDAAGGQASFSSSYDGAGRPALGRHPDDDAVPEDAEGNPLIVPDRLKPLLPSDRERHPHRWTGRITLHLHSVYSDGTLEPEAVVEAAHRAGVRTLALTEHDTFASTMRAWRRAKALGLEYHTGVEISARGGAHVNAVDADPFHPRLAALLEGARERRYRRAAAVVRRLNALDELKAKGIVLTMAEVEALSRHAEGGTIGRPHVARVLVARGLARTVDEAFDRYLKGRLGEGDGVEPDPEVEEVVAAVKEAGGLAFLNHPYSVDGRDEQARDRRVVELLRRGLDGLEVYRPVNATSERGRRRVDERTAKYLLWLDESGLAAAAGSDYHGDDNHLDDLQVWMPKSLAKQLGARLAEANARAIAVLEAAEGSSGAGVLSPRSPESAPAGKPLSWGKALLLTLALFAYTAAAALFYYGVGLLLDLIRG